MLRGIVQALLLALVLTLAVDAPVLGADPTASPGAAASPVLIDPLDPRAGEGASSVGAPLLALLVVIGVGIAAAGLTYVYARAMRRR